MWVKKTVDCRFRALLCSTGAILSLALFGCVGDPAGAGVSGPTGGGTGNATAGGDVADGSNLIDIGQIDVPELPGGEQDIQDVPQQHEDAQGPGKIGWPCESNDECDSDWCVQTPTGKQCSELCIDACTLVGWGCKPAQTLGGDEVLICLPLFPHLCEPCNLDADCAVGVGDITDRCVNSGDGSGSFCGGDCSGKQVCPDGYECAEIDFGEGGLKKQCVPTSGECACSEQAISQVASTNCSATNNQGTCAGVRSCGVEGLSACSAPEPAAEVCDGVDNNCDGQTDEEDAAGCVVYYKDLDSDGFGLSDDFKCLCSPDPTNYKAPEGGDCNDGASQINPGQVELCNGKNDDCDELIDEEDALGCKDYLADVDKDGWGDELDKVCLCEPDLVHNSQKPGDCNDGNENSYPGAPETCGDGDTNCDGKVAPPNTPGCIDFFFDGDKDGFGIATDKKCLCAEDTPWSATEAGDCNDENKAIKPGASELCDTIDNDCDTSVDEPGALDCETYYKDADKDGFGDAGDTSCQCGPQGSYTTLVPGDCNDGNDFISPNAKEKCDGFDNDCDKEIDEKDAEGCAIYYLDEDQDKFGTSDFQCLCKKTAPYTATEQGDCDDELEEVAPGKPELCEDLTDNDCNGFIDEEGAENCTTYFLDSDEDGYGVTSEAKCLCGPTGSFTAALGGDCKDNDKLVSPKAGEVCDNGVDNNCNQEVDEEDAADCQVYYEDLDKDGWGLEGSKKCLCAPALPYLASKFGDCKDSSEDINPDVAEACGDNVDNNCNLQVDEEGAVGCTKFFEDADGDGWGVLGTDKCLCKAAGDWTATQGGDCDDSAGGGLIFPGTACTPASCAGALLTKATMCSGGGKCIGGETVPCPDNFKCLDSEACKTSCINDKECVLGSFCVAGKCEGQKPDGSQCFENDQCQSEFCDNGFCCGDEGSTVCCGGSDSHCDDQNTCTIDTCNDQFQCAAAPNDGATCKDAFCDGGQWTAPKTCGDGKCAQGGEATTCAGSDPCQVYQCTLGGCTSTNADSGTVCSAQTCDGSTVTSPKTCGAAAACDKGGFSSACAGGFKCADANACKTGCAGPADCQTTHFCESGQCLPKKSDGTVCNGSQECINSYCTNGFCCAGGKCCGGKATDCDDSNACTTDACLPTFVCLHQNNVLECVSGVCDAQAKEFTQPRFCAEGACGVGEIIQECAGSNPCVLYGCNSEGCTETPSPIGTPCQAAMCLGSKLTSQKTCNGAGECSFGGSTKSCPGGFLCEDGSSCANGCQIDDDCASGLFCDAPFCLPKRADGVACSADSQCVNAHCENGFCCASGKCCGAAGDCDDANVCTNDKCSAQFKCSYTNNNFVQCESGECTGQSFIKPKTCSGGTCSAGGATLNCAPTSSCFAGGCDSDGCTLTPSPAGTVCAEAASGGGYTFTAAQTCNGTGQCAKGGGQAPCPGGFVCVDGETCGSSCGPGVACQPGWYCAAGNVCQPKRSNGDVCTGDAQCLDLHCANGFCCPAGKCCNQNFHCDDANVCTDDACSELFICSSENNTAPCQDGICDGLGFTHPKSCLVGSCQAGGGLQDCSGDNNCKVYSCAPGGCGITDAAAGTQCQAATCSGSTSTAPLLCNGSGTCAVGGGSSPCPGGYACESATKCRTSCLEDNDCAGSHFCGGDQCQPKRANGDACAANEQCTSTYCTNGYCCQGPAGNCCQQHFHCNDGNECTTDTCSPSNKCTHTTNTSLCEAASCDGLEFTDETYCSNGSCTDGGATADCSGTNGCFAYSCTLTGCSVANVQSGVQCAAQTCTGHQLTQAKTCNGGGACTEGGNAAACAGGFVCANGTSCKTSCALQTDCRTGFYCEATVCQPKRTDGDTCSNNAQCANDYCNSGYCCVDGSGVGTTQCCGGSDQHCDDGNPCTTNTCSAASQCTKQNNSKVCADSSCNGVTYTSLKICQAGACSLGGTETDCVSTNQCRTSQCGESGCIVNDIADGVPCGIGSSCTGSTFASGQKCNGIGDCVTGNTSGPCPGGFNCLDNTQCRTDCTSDTHCQADFFCNGTSCEAEKSNGSVCSDNSQCASNHCTNGFCCSGGKCCQIDANCNDANVCSTDDCVDFVCQYADNTLTCENGSCLGLTYSQPKICDAGQCPASSGSSDCSGTNPCKTYSCGVNGCGASNSPLGTLCAEAGCVGAQLTQAKECNGGGNCIGGGSAPCAGNLKCAGTASCLTECVQHTDCVGGYYCSNDGQCLAKKSNGQSCNDSVQCTSTYCEGNLCCAGGECCTTQAHCDDGNVCTTNSCISNKCEKVNNNNVCQVSDCDGLAFTDEKKCSGGACSLGGGEVNCGGSNSCKLFACTSGGCVAPNANQGTQCIVPSCSNGTLTQAKTCDGGGNCSEGGTASACPGNYACLNGEQCRTICSLPTDCTDGYYCQTGACIAKKQNGQTCNSSGQCGSNWCSNGYCCGEGLVCCAGTSDCNDANVCTTDTCQNSACVFADNTSTCTAGSCAGLTYTLPKTCSSGSCSGGGGTDNCSGVDPCKAYSCTESGCSVQNQPAGIQCMPSTCSGQELTTAKQCNPGGLCSEGGVTADCPGNYLCSTSTTCRTSCSEHAHCVDGYYCHPSATCQLKRPDGDTCSSDQGCQSDYCNNSICCSGGDCCTNSVPCNDGNQCTTDSCSNFSCSNVNNNLQCTASSCNGLTWTAPKFCTGGSCTAGGTQASCGGSNECLQYTCANQAGCGTIPKEEGEVCDSATCSGTLFTPASICNGNGSCVDSNPVQCDNGEVCDGAETCDAVAGCQAGNPNEVFVCGDGTCNPTCETSTSCSTDCLCAPGYTIESGEVDAFNTGGTGGVNRISKYGGSCSGTYPGSEFTYKFVAPLSGTMKVELAGADANTDVLVMEDVGGGCDPDDCVAQGQGSGSSVTWSASAGKTYYISVDREVAGATDFTLYLRYTSGQCHIPFIESWDRLPFPRAWSLESNWQTSQDSPFGATHAKFTGAPTLTNFERSLTSPVFDTTACTNTQLELSWRCVSANSGSPGVTLHVEVSNNGGTNWSEVFNYTTDLVCQLQTTETIATPTLGGSSQARIRLRMTGSTSANLNKLQVDDVKVEAP